MTDWSAIASMEWDQFQQHPMGDLTQENYSIKSLYQIHIQKP